MSNQVGFDRSCGRIADNSGSSPSFSPQLWVRCSFMLCPAVARTLSDQTDVQRSVFQSGPVAIGRCARRLPAPARRPIVGLTLKLQRACLVDDFVRNRMSQRNSCTAQRPLQAATKEVLTTGSRATTTVPLPLELISKVPPSCRSLSRIPLIPTPGVPPESKAPRFSDGMPLPLSSTSRLTWLSERLIRILATRLSEWR